VKKGGKLLRAFCLNNQTISLKQGKRLRCRPKCCMYDTISLCTRQIAHKIIMKTVKDNERRTTEHITEYTNYWIFSWSDAFSDSGGATVFAARGKRLCCRPPGVHFQKFSNFSIFFTVNISTIFSHPKVPRFPARYAPGPSNQIGNWYSYGYKDGNHTMVWTVNSRPTLSWGVYNCLTQWNLGLGWSIVIAKKLRKCLHKKPQTS